MPASVVQTSAMAFTPEPNVLFGTPKFARFSMLKPSASNCKSTRSVSLNRLLTRKSSDAKSNPRPVLRPTPSGRSLLFVSRLRSVPSSTLNGKREA